MIFYSLVVAFVLMAKFNSDAFRPLNNNGAGRMRSLRITMSDGPYRGPDTTPILDTIKSPADMKRLTIKQLKQLSNELRWETINAVAKTGGHLGSSLGVVELTVALHHLFDAPEDKIIWDVAHQSYPHKILTGRFFF